MTEYQTAFAIGASVGACVVSVAFMVAGYFLGRGMRKRDRADAWAYRGSEGRLW